MKRFNYSRVVLPTMLTIALAFVTSPHIGISTKAESGNWMVQATAPIDEQYEYVFTLDPSNILAQDSNYPTEHDVGSMKPIVIDSSIFITARGYISLDEFEARENYLTLGADGFDDYDIAGYFGPHTRIGRIDRVYFKLADYMYDNYADELENKIGIVLIEGRNPEMSTPDTTWEPNILETDGEVLIGWDFAMDAGDRFTYNKPEVDRHFLDQNRLNDISAFVIFSFLALHMESITIEGTHFFEVSNDTPYFQAINQGDPIWREGLDVNFNNRVDFTIESYTITNFDNGTVTDEGTFSITTIDTYDGENTMTIDDVPIIIVAEEDPLLVFDIAPPILIPADGSDWYDTLNVEYGGQVIQTEDLDDLLEYEFDILGNQLMTFKIFNAEDEHLVRVTNQGVSIAEAVEHVDYEVVIGNLLGFMVEHEEDDVIIVDTTEGPHTDWYGEFKFLKTDAEISLDPEYFFEGALQNMLFTIHVVSHEPTLEGADARNRFRFVLTTIEGEEIPESVRFYDLDEDSESIPIIYEYMSGYRATGFKISLIELNDLLFVQRFNANGYFYFDSYFSYEQQAMMFAKSFLAHTDDLQGASQDGICVWRDDNKWTMLADEYGYMENESQIRFEQNDDYTHSDLINEAIERYVYLRNNDGVVFPPFLNVEPPGSTTFAPTLNSGYVGLLTIGSLSLIMVVTYYVMHLRRKKIRI